MMTPEERYTADPEYRMCVDVFMGMIAQARFTPSELRQAAIYASIRHAQMRLEVDQIIIDKEASTHLQHLESWLRGENGNDDAENE